MTPALTPETVLLAAGVVVAGFVFLRQRNRPAPLTPDQIKELRQRGAQILDVRSPGEYASGSIKGSRNIPLDQLGARMSELKKDKPILACCASGMRSGRAVGMLVKAGFTDVHNVGPWQTLKS